MNISELWRLSGVVLDEIYFQAQLNAAGGQKNRFLERYEKNVSSIKRMSFFNMILISFFLLILAIMPIYAFYELINTEITENNIHDLLFANSFSLATYYLMSFVIILMFGLLQLVELMDGTAFKVLIPLPLSKKNLQRLGILVFVKMHYLQFFVLIFTLPIGALLITRSIFLCFALLICNIVNVSFSFYLIVLAANFVSKKIFKTQNPSKLRTVVRIITILLYMIILFNIYSLFGSFSILIREIFDLEIISGTNGKILNILFSLIFYPLSGGYIATLTIIPLPVLPIQLVVSSSIGFILLIIVMILLMNRGNNVLQRLGFPTEEYIHSDKAQDEPVAQVDISIDKPVISLIKTTLIMASRNYTSLFSLLAPIVFTLINLLYGLSSYNGYLDPFLLTFFYIGFIPVILKNGVFTTEENIGTILSSLPLKQKDVFRSKQLLMTFFANTNVVIIFAFQLINSRELFITSGFLVIFANIIAPTVYLLLYAYFFGKLNYTFSLYTVNLEKNILKNILLFLVPTLAVMFSFIVSLIISLSLPTNGALTFLGLVSGNIITLIILELIARKMFQ